MEDLRDAEDEMPVGNFLEYIASQPLSEFHYPLLMTGRAEFEESAKLNACACRRRPEGTRYCQFLLWTCNRKHYTMINDDEFFMTFFMNLLDKSHILFKNDEKSISARHLLKGVSRVIFWQTLK